MKYINLAKKFAQEKYAQLSAVSVGTAMLLASPVASANDIASIGQSAATEIAKFAVMISAIGAAVLSIVVLIQGFRMAFSMIKTAR